MNAVATPPETNTTGESRAALYCALAKAQGEFLPLAKNRTVEIQTKAGGKYRFRYADLEAVLSATRAALAKNGLSTLQIVEQEAGSNQPLLRTVLAHESGATVESRMRLPANDGGDIKNYGAAISYLRRYALSSMLSVAADDDLDEDGNEGPEPGAATKPPVNQQSQKKPENQQPSTYPDDSFTKNLPAWEKAIAAGKKTPDEIIATVESKAKLTDEQRKTIKAIKGPSNENS